MTAKQLRLAAANRRSVRVPKGAMLAFEKVLPAAFVIAWPFQHVMNALPEMKIEPKRKPTTT